MFYYVREIKNTDVVERYEEGGAQVLRTDLDGAVTVRLGAQGIEAEVERAAQGRYWRDRRL